MNKVCDYIITWYEVSCPYCDKPQFVCDGDTDDVSQVDIEAVKCYSCDKLFWLREQSLNNMLDKEFGLSLRKIEDAYIVDGQNTIIAGVIL